MHLTIDNDAKHKRTSTVQHLYLVLAVLYMNNMRFQESLLHAMTLDRGVPWMNKRGPRARFCTCCKGRNNGICPGKVAFALPRAGTKEQVTNRPNTCSFWHMVSRNEVVVLGKLG